MNSGKKKKNQTHRNNKQTRDKLGINNFFNFNLYLFYHKDSLTNLLNSNENKSNKVKEGDDELTKSFEGEINGVKAFKINGKIKRQSNKETKNSSLNNKKKNLLKNKTKRDFFNEKVLKHFKYFFSNRIQTKIPMKKIHLKI